MSTMKRVSATFAAALIAALAQPAQAQCASGWNVFGSSCYRLTSSPMNWVSAESEAESLGGFLASIGSSAENTFVYSTFIGSVTSSSYWIGLNDLVTEGTFVWASGESVVFTSWRANEPNNSGNEDAVNVFNDGTGIVWNDLSATNFSDFYGVVEVQATPEPASILMLGTGLVLVGGVRAKIRRTTR